MGMRGARWATLADPPMPYAPNEDSVREYDSLVPPQIK
jgi:hypothetical protein